jgi:hypothetical protein
VCCWEKCHDLAFLMRFDHQLMNQLHIQSSRKLIYYKISRQTCRRRKYAVDSRRSATYNAHPRGLVVLAGKLAG